VLVISPSAIFRPQPRISTIQERALVLKNNKDPEHQWQWLSLAAGTLL
jgi:hypothetical protein